MGSRSALARNRQLLALTDPTLLPTRAADAIWIVRTGPANSSCLTLESFAKPGRFLLHYLGAAQRRPTGRARARAGRPRRPTGRHRTGRGSRARRAGGRWRTRRCWASAWREPPQPGTG
ncbi:AbfB domain-containing protein [Kitasatospora sp. NPDC058162]|uniref:AbfB domain-containing protein n=1 Tax=Kitasatospora sp. NPDC058162 TaxID=3346362 RepID=UPI0036DF123D